MNRPDPKKLADWQVAAAIEPTLKPITQIAEEFGLQGEEVIPMGKFVAKVNPVPLFSRVKDCKAK